jgi:hypothetical protein
MTSYLGDTAQTMWQRVMFTTSMSAADATDAQWYAMLDAYYFNNALYESVNVALNEEGIWMEGMHPLRNPANRAVEFHVSHLWPGSLTDGLPIVAKTQKVYDAIHQVWKWSNFENQKQLGARQFSQLGNMFIKVATKSENKKVAKVVQSFLKPQHVTKFELDKYGFLVYVRIDVPSTRKVNGKTESYTHTEIWDKEEQSYKAYQHKYGQGASVENLGTPTDAKKFSDFGIDFIPIVHAKFRDTGDDRGDGVFVHALDKIDEANRMATRLHNILFRYNKPLEVVTAGGNDASGKPLPPPTIVDGNGDVVQPGDEYSRSDDDLWTLPGSADVKQLVPQLAYADALSILNAQMQELEDDLPEMAYYRIRDKGELSGRAVRLMLSGAIDRALEARGNGEAAIIRANEIALTLGSKNKLEGFQDLGTYESGAFEHSIAKREIMPLSETERGEAIQADVNSGIPLPYSMRQHGYTDAQIADLEKSPEYQMKMQKQLYELVSAAAAAEIPVETALENAGWTSAKLARMGVQKLAQIKLQQEDTIPPTGL